MSRYHPIAMHKGETYRMHRTSLQGITDDTIEALILDLFDYWTGANHQFDPNNPEKIIWLKESADDVLSGLRISPESISPTTIRRKLNSLIEKGLLLSQKNKQSRNPKDRLFALNTTEINRQTSAWLNNNSNEKGGRPANNNQNAPRQSFCSTQPPHDEQNDEQGEYRDDATTFNSLIVGNSNCSSTYIISPKKTQKGNPPEPACSPLAEAIHPSPHPSADNGASEGDVPPHKKPSADPGNGRESAGEVGKGKKNQGAEGTENENPETESPETGAGIEKDPEGELEDKPNSTARCEERFRAPWPKGEWGQADRRFLNSPEGIKLRQILNGAGIEPERWVDFLHYWAKESQFANWKGNEGWKSKTDIEKLTAIKNALKAQLKRPDRQDTILGIVEGFKSRLRLAEATKRKRDAMMNPSTERRVWSKEEILAKYEAIKAEELQATAK